MKTLLMIFRLNFLMMLTAYCYTVKASEKNLTVSRDSVRFQALLKSGYQYLLKPGEARTDMQMAAGYARKALTMSRVANNRLWMADACLLNAMICRESGQYQAASPLLENALTNYRAVGHYYGEGNTLMEKRYQFPDFVNDIGDRIVIVQQAIAAFNKAKAAKEEADARRELADLLQIVGKELFVALAELKQSLLLYQRAGYNDVHGVYDLIGYVYSKMGIIEEAVRYGRRAEQVALAQRDSSMQLCTIYNRLSYAYFISNDFEKSYAYDQLAMDVAVRHRDNHTITLIASNFANHLGFGRNPNYQQAVDYSLSVIKKYPSMATSAKIGLYAIVVRGLNNLGNHALAERHFNDMLDLSRENKILLNTELALYNTAAQHFIATRQLRPAKEYISKHQRLALAGNLKYQLAYNYLWSFQLDSLRGKYLSAIKNLQLHRALKDSLQGRAKEDQIAMLNVRFDTERKDNELKMKAQNIDQLTRQTALQNQLLKEAQRNRNITVALLLLLIVCLVLLYSRYQTRQKINKATADHNRTLQKMVKEREWLIRELHHRVKNNLQTVTSLLESQSVFLKGDALNALKESQHRVQAMSLIHQKLYLADNLAMVNMAGYVRDLVEYLKDSFDFADLQLNLEIDPIDLDVSLAIPIGLIMNEAITNSVKYAFPQGRHGIIKVDLKQQEDSHIFLTIKDNGVGFPDEYLQGKPGSLGIILIRGLAGELGGNLEIINNQGTQILLSLNSVHEFNRINRPASEYFD